jgi:hypothetical protein
MFSSKIDTYSLSVVSKTPFGGNVYYDSDKDITIVEYGEKQRIYFERVSDFDNLPCRFKKCQHFGYENISEYPKDIN